MTTFTVTTNSDMDSLTPKTGADVYNVNGATLTINSDVRWAKNSTSTTGPFAGITISATLGGNVIIDGTQVWLIPYDGGVSTVPVAGVTITGDTSGATGELIGVWSAINTTPTTSGSAMPTTGFIKLKSKSGTFQDNENLSQLGIVRGVVNSATGGKRGWLEIVGQEASTATVPRLGTFEINGDWFEIDDTTSGSAGQIIQLPNSGGTNTFWPGIQIETGVGTGVYEWYPALSTITGTAWSTTHMGTDARAKFVECMSSGQVRIGSNGTSNIGYVPPSGCKIRIPNVLLSNCVAGARNLNVVPNATFATRYDFTTTNAGVINFDKAMGDWYLLFAQPYQVTITNYATHDQINISECASAITITDYCNGVYSNADAQAGTFTSNFATTTMTNCKIGRAGTIAASDYSLSFQNCNNLTITDSEVGGRTNRTNAAAYSLFVNVVNNATFDNYCVAGGGGLIQSSVDVHFIDTKCLNSYIGSTTATLGMYAFLMQVGCVDVTFDGYSNYLGLSDVHYYAGFLSTSGTAGYLIQNIGTYASPYNMGSANAGGVLMLQGGNNTGGVIKRVYLQNTRSAFITTTNSDFGVLIQDCKSDYADAQVLACNNTQIKNIALTWNNAPQASVYGTHFMETFESSTVGRVIILCNEKTTVEPSASSYEVVAGTPKFTSANTVVMPSLTDEIIWTHQYYILGHNSFTNIAPTLYGTSTGNITLEYKIDVNDGNGFSASWLALTGANLSAETISATVGFKLKIRATVNTASTATALQAIRIQTDVDATSQQVQYPLNTVNASLVFTGLETGTEVVLFRDSDDLELDRQVIASTTYTYNYEWNSDDGDVNVYALIWKDDKQVIKQTGLVLDDTGTSIPIAQQDDLVYSASPTLACTVDYLNELLIMDTGVTEMSVPELYSVWKDDVLLTNNAQYQFAFSIVGGNTISGSKSIPQYCFLENGWKVRPQEANHTLAVTDGIIVDAGGSDPFVNTLGAYTVRINYEQPVQAITVSTGGGGGATAAQVWSYTTRELTSGGVSAIQSGLATSSQISALNDFDPATEQVIVGTNNDKTDYTLANNSITSSVVANNAFNNSSFTTGYFNEIEDRVETAIDNKKLLTTAKFIGLK